MAGTSYNGLPSNIAPPASVGIASSTDASPVVVQTSSAHGMKTGDWVDISGHQTNWAANGIWQVVVVDTTHFQLTGSTGNGVGGTTGTAQPLAFTGNVSLNPADGDPYDASTYVPGMSCLADRTSFLAKNLGAWKLSRIQTFAANSDSNTLWAQQVNVTNAWALPNSVPSFEINIVNGDFVDISMATTGVANGGGASLCLFGIMSAFVPPGISPTGLYSKLAGSNQGVSPSSNPVPLHLRGQTLFSGSSGNLFISPGFYAIGSSGTSFSMQGDYTIIVYVWRQTGWSQ